MSAHELFSGKAHSSGGLSNEVELAKLCPQQFSLANPWSQYVQFFQRHGADLRQWRWKKSSNDAQTQQLQCFVGLLESALPDPLRMAIAGWMLSEMLTDVPEDIKPICRV